MEFRLTLEQEIFKRSVREYCAKNVEPRAREIDERATIPGDMIRGLAEVGVFGCTIPEKYDGSALHGEEMQYANIAVHELSRSELSMSLPVYILLSIGWGGEFLSYYASEELKAEILPKIASGEWFWGINVTEPEGGSDVSAIKTTATKRGDKYIINGEKCYISGVSEAYHKGGGHNSLFVTSPTKGHRGMTFFATPAKLPGISLTTYKDMGRMGLSQGGFVYENVELDERYILGEVDRGFYLCMEGFNVARALVASACLGCAEKCLEIGLGYVKQRRAFGRPIGKFEGISFEIAEDYTRLEMLKLLLQKGCWMIDQYNQDHSNFTPKEINPIIAQCKWLTPQVAVEVIKHAMMYCGAFGYTKDSPLEMAMRGIMSYVVGAEGAANIMKLIVVRDALGEELVATRP